MTVPPSPVLVAGVRDAAWLEPQGEIETISLEQAVNRLGGSGPVILCHGGAAARRLGVKPFAALDVLELFAFVRPARFCLPTPRGLAEVLGLPIPGNMEKEAESLGGAVRALIGEVAADGQAASVASIMGRAGWPWGKAVEEAIAAVNDRSAEGRGDSSGGWGLRVWEGLEKWEETPPQTQPGSEPVSPQEARERLFMLLGPGAEARPQQAEYAAAAARAFEPRQHEDEPHLVLAEAGTGVGKTLGYIAPASLWSERNGAGVWISTFTRNLQRQLDGELDRLYPDALEKEKHVVIRKGRENYFCLLNFADAVGRFGAGTVTGAGQGGGEVRTLGLLARWALASRDGDMVGGDFPAWLAGLLGRAMTVDLTDTRGECIYSACPHYDKCFIERTIRRARRARIVVANHALVMIQAAMGGGGEGFLPSRYVIDEGHHVFDAADGAFSAHLSGFEAAELRRWIIGAEKKGRVRNRGLKARIEDLISTNETAVRILDDVIRAAHALPAPGWGQRISDGAPAGAAEAFLGLVRQQVYARDGARNSPYSLETAAHPPVDGLLDAASSLAEALQRLARPLADMVHVLGDVLDDGAGEMDSPTRTRIESVIRGLERRGAQQVKVWRDMLGDLCGDGDGLEDNEQETQQPRFVDWFSVERIAGRDFDAAFHRHWLDPTRPFAEAVLKPSHGVLVTSATLRDCSGDDEADWRCALTRSGASHLESNPSLMTAPSPFDYPNHTRVMVVNDVNKDDTAQVGAAYRELFMAAGGGGLGLFTAIARLKAVYELIARPLDEAGIDLMAQHVDPLDTGTLIDIFRAEEDSCLLGTDAVRDGIDVPGRSLRIIVFDRTPWPRPDILHRARRGVFGGPAYDEMLVRLRLKQAYGRLVRRSGDRGVFVMLDRALPSRLARAFPQGVEVRRMGLAEAVRETRSFIGGSN